MKSNTDVSCRDAQELVSAIYDGQPVPEEIAGHVDACPACRESLLDYSRIGAEMRLLASRKTSAIPIPSNLLHRRRFQPKSAPDKVLIPRFAIAAAAALFLTLTATLATLHAQQSPHLWFQFSLQPKTVGASGRPLFQHAAKAGYDDKILAGNGGDQVIGSHIAVSEVNNNSVRIAIRSRRYSATNADEVHLKNELNDLDGHLYTYEPGTPLEIPVEGGGTLIIQGKIVDHQPKISAGGIPLEPDADQLIVSSPILVSGNDVLFNMKGSTAVANGIDREALLYVPGTGLMRFALQAFPGASQAKASWGELDFKLDGRSYSLRTASPMSGGDQPHTIWVKREAGFNAPPYTDPEQQLLSADQLGAPHWLGRSANRTTQPEP